MKKAILATLVTIAYLCLFIFIASHTNQSDFFDETDGNGCWTITLANICDVGRVEMQGPARSVWPKQRTLVYPQKLTSCGGPDSNSKEDCCVTIYKGKKPFHSSCFKVWTSLTAPTPADTSWPK